MSVPERSDVTSKVNVCRFEPAVGEPGPICPVPETSTPEVAVQLTEKAAVAVPPAGTVTVWEMPPLTVQFVGTPLSVTV